MRTGGLGSWRVNPLSAVRTALDTEEPVAVAGQCVQLPFRGMAISWIGYRGPDGGIALYRWTAVRPASGHVFTDGQVQPVVFAATGLADATTR